MYILLTGSINQFRNYFRVRSFSRVFDQLVDKTSLQVLKVLIVYLLPLFLSKPSDWSKGS